MLIRLFTVFTVLISVSSEARQAPKVPDMLQILGFRNQYLGEVDKKTEAVTGCADFSGSWGGTCEQASPVQHSFPISVHIQQLGCSAVSIGGQLGTIGGVARLSESTQTSSHDQSISTDFNKAKTELLERVSINGRGWGPGANFLWTGSGTGTLRIDAGKLHIHSVLHSDLYVDGVYQLMEPDVVNCMLNKLP